MLANPRRGARYLLARLLSPTDYGVFDICVSFVQIGVLFGDAGLGVALVRKAEEPTDEEYSSVFVVNMAAGLVLALVFMTAAPLLIAALTRSSTRWRGGC